MRAIPKQINPPTAGNPPAGQWYLEGFFFGMQHVEATCVLGAYAREKQKKWRKAATLAAGYSAAKRRLRPVAHFLSSLCPKNGTSFKTEETAGRRARKKPPHPLLRPLAAARTPTDLDLAAGERKGLFDSKLGRAQAAAGNPSHNKRYHESLISTSLPVDK